MLPVFHNLLKLQSIQRRLSDVLVSNKGIKSRVIVGNFPAVKLPPWWAEAVIDSFGLVFFIFRDPFFFFPTYEVKVLRIF